MALFSEYLNVNTMDASYDASTESTGLASAISLDRDEDRRGMFFAAVNDGVTSLLSYPFFLVKKEIIVIVFVTSPINAGVGFSVLPVINIFEAKLCRRFYRLLPTLA